LNLISQKIIFILKIIKGTKFLGVGLQFKGEYTLQKNYKSCKFLAIDPDERNKPILESGNHKFVKMAANDIDTRRVALIKEGKSFKRIFKKSFLKFS
jgi:hypothetical protein